MPPLVPKLVIGEMEHLLTGDLTTIGRGDDNTILLADASVSIHQAEIRTSADCICVLRDLSSDNSTMVNGQHAPEVVLCSGDTIHFRENTFQFFLPGPAVALIGSINESST